MSNVLNLSNPCGLFYTTIVAPFKNASPLQQKVTLAALAILTLAVLGIGAQFIWKKVRRQSSSSPSSSNNNSISMPSSAILSTPAVPSAGPSTPSSSNPPIPTTPKSIPSPLSSARPSSPLVPIKGPRPLNATPSAPIAPSTGSSTPPSSNPAIPTTPKSIPSPLPSARPSTSSSSDTIWIGRPPSSEVQPAVPRIAIDANRLYVQYPDVDQEQDIYMKPTEYGPTMFKIAHCSIRHFLTEAPLNTITKKSYMIDMDINVPGEPDQPICLCLKRNSQLTLGLLNNRLVPIWGSNLQIFDSNNTQKNIEEIDEFLKSKQPK